MWKDFALNYEVRTGSTNRNITNSVTYFDRKHDPLFIMFSSECTLECAFISVGSVNYAKKKAKQTKKKKNPSNVSSPNLPIILNENGNCASLNLLNE